MTNSKENASTENPSTPVLGPWTETTITKLNISALEVTVSKTVECSHVPPEAPPCMQASSGSNASVLAFLEQAAQVIVAKLDEIRSVQNGNVGESDNIR